MSICMIAFWIGRGVNRIKGVLLQEIFTHNISKKTESGRENKIVERR